MAICSLCGGSGRDIVTPATRSCSKCRGSGQEYGGQTQGRATTTANVELGSFGKKFLGFGLILLGLWTAPGPGAAGAAWIIPGSLLALGALGLIKGIREGLGSGWHPFEDTRGSRGTILRFFWTLRPRSWLFAWAVIIGVFVVWGSPHLLWEYGGGRCAYLGLNGMEAVRVYGECPLVKAFPLG